MLSCARIPRGKPRVNSRRNRSLKTGRKTRARHSLPQRTTKVANRTVQAVGQRCLIPIRAASSPPEKRLTKEVRRLILPDVGSSTRHGLELGRRRGVIELPTQHQQGRGETVTSSISDNTTGDKLGSLLSRVMGSVLLDLSKDSS